MVLYPDLEIQCFVVVMIFDVPFNLATNGPKDSSKSESEPINLELLGLGFDDTFDLEFDLERISKLIKDLGSGASWTSVLLSTNMLDFDLESNIESNLTGSAGLAMCNDCSLLCGD